MTREARSLAWSAASLAAMSLAVATALAVPTSKAPEGIGVGLVAYMAMAKGCLVAAAKEAYD